jgi:hypothetical protein
LSNENGTLAKLISLRQAFLASIEAARSQFVGSIKTARESYLNQIVDVTMADPQLSDVEKALSTWNPQFAVVAPNPLPPMPAVDSGMVQIGQSGVSEKFPMKKSRGVTVYGRCPSCNSYILEAEAKFCSRCAYPLDEAFPLEDPTTHSLNRRAAR